MAISLTRLSGGNTPADGSDPRTFPAIWNASATAIEAAIAEGGGGSITVSDTAPTDPAPGNGDLWWNSTDGKLFVYYVDTDTSQWVDAAGPSVAVQDTAPTGYEGQLWLDSTDGSMYVYYTDPGGGASSWIGAVSNNNTAGNVIQVVSTNKNDTFSTTSSSLVDVTGLTASITPSSTSNKVLVIVSTLLSNSGAGNPGSLQLADTDNNAIAPPDSPGSRTQGYSSAVPNDTATAQMWTFNFLHSPSTTSAFTYKVRARTNGGTLYVNRTGNDTNDANTLRGSSTITLMEVAG